MSQYKIRSVPEVFTAAAEHLEKAVAAFTQAGRELGIVK